MNGREWLTDDFVQSIFGPGVKMDDVNIALAGPAGDNYLSDIFRVTSGNQSYVVKEKPSGKVRSMVDFLSAFEKELVMYDFLEDVENITGERFAPKRINYKDMIVLEDLKPYGFKAEDRRTQLGLDHCRVAIQQMAKFHAASHIVMRNPEKYKKYKFLREDIFFGSNNGDLHKTVVPLMKKLAEEVTNWTEISHLSTKLEKYVDSNFELCRSEVLKGSNSGFLIHGDFHTNNIMFNDSMEMRMIDFQFVKENDPVIDIIIFMLTSMKPEVRYNHLDELLQLYTENLNKLLISFNVSSSLTSENIKIKLKDHKHFIFYTGAIRTALVLTPSSEEIKDNSLAAETSNEIYRSPLYQQIMTKLIKKLDSSGTFNLKNK